MEPAMDHLSDGTSEVWSKTYRGHRISVQRTRAAWTAIFDNSVQLEQEFETAEEAEAWLRRRVDSRIAEAIFPGLANS